MPKKYKLSKKYKKVKRGRKSTRKNIKRKTIKKRKIVKKRKSTRRQKGGNFNPENTQKLRDKLNEFGFEQDEVEELVNELQKVSRVFTGESEQIVSQLEGIQGDIDDPEERRKLVREFVYQQEENFDDENNITEYEGDSEYDSELDEED
jgi:hypothetical protein